MAATSASLPLESSPPEESFANGWFKLAIPTDGSAVFVKKIVRHSGEGKAVTREDILKQLKKEKVIHGINVAAIDKLLALVEADDIPPQAFPIALGNVKQGENGSLSWAADDMPKSEHPVFVSADMHIATRQTAVQGKPGKNVFGKTKQPKPIFDPQLIAGDGIRVHEGENGDFIYESIYAGELKFESDKVYVDPHLNVSEDKLEVHMDIADGMIAGGDRKINIDDVLNVLKLFNISYGILRENIQASLTEENAQTNRFIEKVLVAKGKPAVHGIDARLVVDEKLSVGKLLPNGKINYYEKSYPWNVKTNDVIGHIVPAQPEVDGTDVKGETIPANPPRIPNVVLEGIEEDEDGLLRACVSGVLLVNELNIKVSDNLVIHGDVCHRTGNIHVEKTVTVNGYVEAGFIVEAGGEIVVADNVEDANLQSRSNILIKSGVRGSHSVVCADGNISLGFAENAKLQAKGNITVKNSLVSCETTSEGILYIGSSGTNKSTILGGVTTAVAGVEAANLGSEGCSKTLIYVGMGPEAIESLKDMVEELRKRKVVIDDLDQAFAQHKKSKKPESVELLKKVTVTRKKMLEEFNAVKERYDVLRAQVDASRKTKVVVHHNIYPGVHIHLLDKVYEVSEKRKGGTFCMEGEHFIYQPKF